MKKLRVLRLKTKCSDRATKLSGMLTHLHIDMEGTVSYLFQPEGLSDEGMPLNRLHVELARLDYPKDAFHDIEVPFDILGSQVTEDGSGYIGMAVGFVRHTNGCFHVQLQAAGKLEKSNSPIKSVEVDLRQCSGEKIPVLTPGEVEESEKRQPSPGPAFDDEAHR